MPEINTLVQDIQYLVGDRKGWFTGEVAETYSQEVTLRLSRSFGEKERVPALRLSQMGPKCPCALWHSIHRPDLAEPLPASAVVKFTYGHLIEALTIVWAKAAGHEVTGEQDALSLDGIVGHRDCIIDGCLVDVKSAATRSFQKFRDGTLAQSDSFGYLDQLDGYLAASADDPLLRVKDRAYLLVVDKQLGHMCLYEHRHRRTHDGTPLIMERIRQYKEIVGRDTPPDCTCQTIKDGESGNFKLDVTASYNAFKHCCAGVRQEKLRTFLYSDGPRYLTKVVRLPKHRDGRPITEVDKHGNVVYN